MPTTPLPPTTAPSPTPTPTAARAAITTTTAAPGATTTDQPSRSNPAQTVGQFIQRVGASLADNSLVRLLLSGPTPEAAPLDRITCRLIDLRGAPALSVASRDARQETTLNLPIPDVAPWLRSQLLGPTPRFRNARLDSTSGDWQLSLPESRPARLVRHAARSSTPPPRLHDRAKARTLTPAAADWLHALGLTNPAGSPLPSRSDKVQQIDRYTEVLRHLVADANWAPGTPLHAVDMGCGRGYLTFAAWQLLHRQLAFPTRVTGIEARPALVEETNAIARQLQLEGLEFQAGSIADATLDQPDLLIALHACNTATDDALLRGIDAGCRLIVVAPCCHQQLRPQLQPTEPFVGPLRHGLFAERFAEWLTDALRALFLEWAGYRVKAIEFVSPEHTPRNLLLAGVLTHAPFTDILHRDRILDLKARFGIAQHPLDPLLVRTPTPTPTSIPIATPVPTPTDLP